MLQFTENRQRNIGLSLTTNPRTVLRTIGNQGPQGAAGTNGTNGTNGANGADGVVQAVVAGTNITVDATDPANPIVSSSAAGVTDGDKGDIVVSSSGAVWTLDTVPATKGGTGVANNAASTITISGSFGTTFTVSALTSVTLPTSGTLATLAGSETLTNKTLTSPVINTAVTGTAIATQAQQETGTATDVLVSPGRQHYHPSAAKGWIKINSTITSILASYNVTSITDNGTGNPTVTWDVDFSSTSYCLAGQQIDNATYTASEFTGQAAGSCTFQVFTVGAVPAGIDPSLGYCIAAFGDQ